MWASESRFSAVDLGAGRMKFWEGGLKSCPSCSGSNISHSTNCAGIRRNGDGYGTTVYSCNDCSWKTSFEYDESSDTYFYETKFWGEEHKPKPVIPYQDMDEELTKKYTKVMKLVGAYAVRQNMKEDGVFPEAIDKFVTELLSNSNTKTITSQVIVTSSDNIQEEDEQSLSAEDQVIYTDNEEVAMRSSFECIPVSSNCEVPVHWIFQCGGCC